MRSGGLDGGGGGGHGGGGGKRLDLGYLPKIKPTQPPDGWEVAWETKEGGKDDSQVRVLSNQKAGLAMDGDAKSREDMGGEGGIRVSMWTGSISVSGPPSAPVGSSEVCQP